MSLTPHNFHASVIGRGLMNPGEIGEAASICLGITVRPNVGSLLPIFGQSSPSCNAAKWVAFEAHLFPPWRPLRDFITVTVMSKEVAFQQLDSWLSALC